MSINAIPNMPIPPMVSEEIIGVPVVSGSVPRQIVVIRLLAFGDSVITLPVLNGLRKQFPDSNMTVVTSSPYTGLFRAIMSINNVYGVPIEASTLRRSLHIASIAAQISRPDIVLDLQHSRASQLLRRLLRPAAWAVFDRFGPKAALERYLDALNFADIQHIQPDYHLPVYQPVIEDAKALLEQNGTNMGNGRPLICLNPAGGWPTKHWPIEHYIQLGRLFVEQWDATIVLMGTDNVRKGAEQIKQALGDDALDLVDKTSHTQALGVIAHLKLMVSDDSGLMHLAWVNGIPTVGLFGASRSAWSRPYGPHTFTFGSEDLACGACMNHLCSREDLHCLRRVTPEHVFERCALLLQ